MSPVQWHVDDQLWRAYAAGGLDEVTCASVDAHVSGCATCQAAARSLTGPATMDSLWRGISADVSRVRLPWTLRWLRRLGLPEDDLTVLAASDGLLLPWALAVASAMVCVLVAALFPLHEDVVFVLLGPLIPVVAVAAAFDATDPLRTLSATAPFSQLRLTLLRTAATLAVALPATTAIGLGLPGLGSLAFSWLLPSFVLTLATLVLLTWSRPWTASGLVCLVWAAVVGVTAHSGDVATLTGLAVQVVSAVVTAGLAAVVFVQCTSAPAAGGQR